MRVPAIPGNSRLCGWSLLLLLSCAFAACRGERDQTVALGNQAPPNLTAGNPSAGTGQPSVTAARSTLTMEKWVSPRATVVLYKPAEWQVEEAETETGNQLVIRDPSHTLEAAMTYGQTAGGDAIVLARQYFTALGRESPDLTITSARRAPDGARIAVEGTFTDRAGVKRGFRLWASSGAGRFAITRIAAPAERLEPERATLLSILANVRVIKGPAPRPAPTAPLVTRRLRDGSASFQAPSDWQVQELGPGAFVAADPAGSPSFIVAKTEVLDPRLGVRPPNTPVAPYQPPRQALAMLATAAGIASNFNFLWVNPRPDVDAVFRQRPNSGPVTTEEFLYTFDAKGTPGKAYSFGISFGSQSGTVWTLWHMTVGAPADKFDALVPAFVTMLQSYRIDEAFARAYVQRGMENLRRLQQETARITARNAEEIHAMMQAAYDERQRSQDYIDYQRTNYIRGEQDWISDMEGGAVYHTDSWGTKNTATGEYWEGAPYDYVNFTGGNPKYDEQMVPVDSRELWERHVR
jgi:hypothetical protein